MAAPRASASTAFQAAVRFKDKSDGIAFVHHSHLPINKPGRFNIAALQLYAMFRNTVYDSYRQKRNNDDFAQDIREYKPQFQESNQRLSARTLYQDPVYQYAVAVAIDAIKAWQNSEKKMQAYIAYDEHNKKVGFVNYSATTVNQQAVVYIAQAGVKSLAQSIGRRLMECVLSDYPVGTQFYVLTRLFNVEAKILYEYRLKFSPIDPKEITELGYDPGRYCGFKYRLTQEFIDEIKAKQIAISD